MKPLLQVENLTVRYGPVRAVEGVSIHVEAGEIVTVLGSNGAGKTSLIAAIMGRVRYQGSVIGPNGSGMENQATHERVRDGIGLVPQGRGLFRELTVQENLIVATSQISRKEVSKRIEQIYDYFPLLGRLTNRRAGHLSGGEQQALAIARVLLLDPVLLILDEPSFGLSPSMRVTVLDVVTNLRTERGLAVLLAEQFSDLALPRSDRAFVMANGSCVWDGRAADLDALALKKAYLGN